MTDRRPGAPGQYTMTVDASEAQKILTGEPVTVTLVRDDQPIVEGTPYNKASVLPDDLAAKLCPAVVDPTPADAFNGLIARRPELTLLASGWVGTGPYTQSFRVDGILETDTPRYGVVYSADNDTRIAERDAFAAIDDLETGAGTVVFTCFDTKPDIDLLIHLEVSR